MIKNKRGASIIWVLCLMVVVLIVGGSILSAGAMASGVAVRYRNAKNCYQYTKTLARVLTDDITGFSLSPADPWYAIAQAVYDAKVGDSTNDVVLSATSLHVDFSDAPRGNAPVTQTDIVLTNQSVYITVPYAAATIGGEDEEPVAEQPEETAVQFDMSIQLRTEYAGQTYIIFLRYRFVGTTVGYGDGIGRITSGAYEYVGAFETP